MYLTLYVHFECGVLDSFSGSECPRVLTSEEMDARTEQARLSIQSYRSRRNEMLKRREEERIHRNDIKSNQLTWAEDLNVRLL